MFPVRKIPDAARLKGRVLVAITFTANTVVFTFEPYARITALGPVEHTAGGGSVRQAPPFASTTLVSTIGLEVKSANCDYQGLFFFSLDGQSVALLNDEAGYEAYSIELDTDPEIHV